MNLVRLGGLRATWRRPSRPEQDTGYERHDEQGRDARRKPGALAGHGHHLDEGARALWTDIVDHDALGPLF